ncbi:MAG: hypothetical protein K0B11_16840 [Mariniphaga sp.]|nr:hypothetical protein [Mariniphaga sp.]
MENNELNEVEKKILFQIEDGYDTKKALEKNNLKITPSKIKEILTKFIELKLIDSDPYKDKDLEIYLKLKTKKEKEKFKKKNPPSFFLTEKGRKILGTSLF